VRGFRAASRGPLSVGYAWQMEVPPQSLHSFLFLKEQIKGIIIMMMMPFNCSYRNKNEPSAIYPSFGYSLSPALPPPPQSTHLLRILCRLYGHFFLGCVVLAVFSFAASPSPGVPSRLPSSHAARARTSPLSRPAAAAVHLSLSRPSQVTHGRNG
jgi:hypothetical protein